MVQIAKWWLAYGIEVPSLMNFAVRVLSLTCSASACERNWSTFNQVHTKRRNRLDQISMVALVYVMYNKRLKIKKLMRKAKMDKQDEDPLVREEIESDDEWVVPQLTQVIGEGSGSGTQNEDPLDDNLIDESPIEDTNTLNDNLDELDVQRLENQIGIDEEDVNDVYDYEVLANQDARGKRPMPNQFATSISRSVLPRGGSLARGRVRGGSNAQGGGSIARGGSLARGRVGSKRASSRGGAGSRGAKRGRKRKNAIGDEYMRAIDADDEGEWIDLEGEDEEDGSPPIRYQDDSIDDESSGDDEDLGDDE